MYVCVRRNVIYAILKPCLHWYCLYEILDPPCVIDPFGQSNKSGISVDALSHCTVYSF